MTSGSVCKSLSSWNARLSGFVKSHRAHDALKLYHQMQIECVKPDAFTFVRVLNACASLAALEEGRLVHEQVIQYGFESDLFVGNSLLDMYGKCGNIEDAQRVFIKMPSRDVVSWSSMLAGHVKCGEGHKALELFRNMQAEGVKPNPVTFVAVLNACASVMALEEGRHLHSQILHSGCESNEFVGSALVGMYAKCGSIEDAQKVFQKIPVRDVITWNAMLSGYVKCEQGEKALELFQKMQADGVKPTHVTFVLVLNACASVMMLEEGRSIHAKVIRSGYEINVTVGNALVDMYGKCGSLQDAQRVFHAMPTRNVVSWSAMLAGYVKCEEAQKALEVFRQMLQEGVRPDPVTFVVVLNACVSAKAVEEGRRVHAQAIACGYESNMFVGRTTLEMYTKCGCIEDAQRVFNGMSSRNLASCNAMLAGYVKCDEGHKALELFRQMQAEGLVPNSATFVVVLNACANIMALEEGRSVHRQVIRSGCESDFVRAALVDMYAKCQSIEDAEKVFHTMPIRDVVCWSAMLAGYVKCSMPGKALELFTQMQEAGVLPNPVIFVLVLNACTKMMNMEEGRRVHVQVIERNCEADLFVASTLVDMYAKCGNIEDAQRVFNAMTTRDVVTWNVMLAGFVKCEEGKKALKLFQEMQAGGVKPNSATLVVALNACASISALDEGQYVHQLAIESGFESDLSVGNSLIDMYGKCRSLEKAHIVFNRISNRDVVSWSSLLAAYVKCEKGQEALELFHQMQKENVRPDPVTFVVLLKACASIMALKEGRHVHSLIIQSGCESDVYVGSSLVDMYAKCGSIEDSQRVFNRMPYCNVVAWSAMLGGLAMHGHAREALQLFKEMYQAAVEINKVTFVCILSACSHGGLVDEGIHLFESMSSVYGVSPTVEHYVCMVDIFGRAGRLEEAENLLKGAPNVCNDPVALMALLGACHTHGNVGMGVRIAQKILELEPSNDECHVLLSNIYAAAGQWSSSAKIK